MALLELRSDECGQCFNLRRGKRELLEEQGVAAEHIDARLQNVLCPEHEAKADEQRKRERRARRV